MRLILRLRMAAAMAALAAAALAAPAAAQDTNAPAKGWIGETWDWFKASGVAQGTNWSGVVYGTLAPKLANGHKNVPGGGALVLYNFNRYAGLGVGADYLERFSLISANITLQAPFQPLAWTGWSWATNVWATPILLGGAGKPLSGTSSDVAVIADVGGAVEFGHLWHGRFTVGATWGQWINAGPYSGKRYHAFLGWVARF